MKLFTKRLLSVLFSIIMTLTIIPFAGSIVSAEESGGYQTGDLIEFGSYPQSVLSSFSEVDRPIITALNSLAGSTDQWTSYGYYCGSGDGQMAEKDYMRYTDIVYNGVKYRGVYFDSYRPSSTMGISTVESSLGSKQDENSFYPETTYWFAFMPLKWRVLDPAEGLVLCEKIIDSQPYNNYIISSGEEYYGDASKTYYASNYYYSSIRRWLNEDFYNTAFTKAQKKNIKTTTLDNSCIDDSTYDAPSCSDNVFLLSFNDTLNENYGFSSEFSNSSRDPAKWAESTRYAQCQGLYSDDNPLWRLRTPVDSSRNIDVLCDTYDLGGESTDSTDNGIRPACTLRKLKYTVSGYEDTLASDNGTSTSKTRLTASIIISVAIICGLLTAIIIITKKRKNKTFLKLIIMVILPIISLTNIIITKNNKHKKGM